MCRVWICVCKHTCTYIRGPCCIVNTWQALIGSACACMHVYTSQRCPCCIVNALLCYAGWDCIVFQQTCIGRLASAETFRFTVARGVRARAQKQMSSKIRAGSQVLSLQQYLLHFLSAVLVAMSFKTRKGLTVPIPDHNVR